MIAFAIQRVLQALVVVVAVGALAFTLFRFVGDPINNMVGQDASLEQRQAIRESLGLDRPAPVQLARFLYNTARGELGVSYRQARPVATLLGERIPATLELCLVASVLTLALGVPLGVLAGVYPRRASSRVSMFASLLGISLPPFFVGIMLIMIFSVTLGWLPSYGRGDVVRLGFWTTGFLTVEGLKSLVLPSITLAAFQTALIMRLVRAQILQVLRTDYVRFAQARGLPDRVVHFRHALKNTLVPIITVTGLQIGSIIAFAIITETVFQWPGMGLLFIQAVQFGDVPVMAAYLMLVAVLFVVINLVCDLLYVVVDPRIRTELGSGSGAA